MKQSICLSVHYSKVVLFSSSNDFQLNGPTRALLAEGRDQQHGFTDAHNSPKLYLSTLINAEGVNNCTKPTLITMNSKQLRQTETKNENPIDGGYQRICKDHVTFQNLIKKWIVTLINCCQCHKTSKSINQLSNRPTNFLLSKKCEVY